MKIGIQFTGLAKEVTGEKEIWLELADKSPYKEVIRQVGSIYPALIGLIITNDGVRLLSSVLLVRNGVELVTADMLENECVAGEKLSFIFVIVGGSNNGNL